jgi:hypothetical protein
MLAYLCRKCDSLVPSSYWNRRKIRGVVRAVLPCNSSVGNTCTSCRSPFSHENCFVLDNEEPLQAWRASFPLTLNLVALAFLVTGAFACQRKTSMV